MLSTNQTLHKGRYRVIDHFTTNPENSLYEAYDTVSDTKVVIKECVGSPSKVFTPSQREASDNAFFGAAQALTQMKHDSLVNVHDYFSDVGRQYLVLEVVEGFDLNKYLGTDAERPELNVILGWADHLLNALHFLHTLAPPVIHGDIQPGNIRFTATGEVKLLAANVDALTNGSSERIQTSASASGGNVNYQPLEQLWPGLDRTSQQSLLKDYDERSERVLLGPLDAQSDVYSLGACLYHILTGVLPIDALDRSIALREYKPDPLRKANEIVKDIPVEISDAVMKALEIRRENRFYSAVVMAQVLRTAVVKAAERRVAEPTVQSPPGVPETTDLPEQIPQNSVENIASAAADSRQRELEAEQQKLEEEQKRIEERRQAIEAERSRLEREAELERQRSEQERRRQEAKRLEAQAELERSLAAKKLAEIEAEKQKRLAEAERLEREAEEERKRAEERLAYLQAEKERRLSEEQNAAATAREELQRAEQVLMDLSHADPPKTAFAQARPEEDLLELNVLPTPAPQTVPKPLEILVDVPAADKHEDDLVAAKPFDVREYGFEDYSGPSNFNWPILAIGAAGVLLVMVVLGWMLLGSGSGDTDTEPTIEVKSSVTAPEPNSNASTAGDLSTSEQDAVVSEQAVPKEIPAAGPPAATSENFVDLNQQNDTVAARPVERPKSVEKPKKVAAATTNKPAPKKVTVDDLINDN